MGKLQIILILKIVDVNNSVVLNQKAKWMEKMYLLELTYLCVYIYATSVIQFLCHK